MDRKGQQQQPPAEAPPAKRVRKRVPADRINLWVAFSLILIMIVGAGSVAFYIWYQLEPTAAGQTVRVEIPRGSSSNKIADLLAEEGIIRNASLFKYYLKYKEQGDKFQAGIYELAPGMDRDAIIAKLNAGETVKAETIRFTIPEGYTLMQIADKLSSEGLVDKDKFLEIASSSAILGTADATLGIPDDENMLYRLEGYMFPETYEMAVDSDEQAIISRMLKETDRKLSQLSSSWMDDMEEHGLNFHQLLTIASIIEREVVVDAERALVSGVIYNRLKDNERLQIDATVQYLLDKPKERLLEKDLEVVSPYNTYLVSGLPPGPIASPSMASIQAALYPEETDYKFYVAKRDGTHEHLFAKTYSQHQKNIKLSQEAAKGAGQ